MAKTTTTATTTTKTTTEIIYIQDKVDLHKNKENRGGNLCHVMPQIHSATKLHTVMFEDKTNDNENAATDRSQKDRKARVKW